MIRLSLLVAATLIVGLCTIDAALLPVDPGWRGTTAVREPLWDPATVTDPLHLLMLSPLLLAGGFLVAGIRQRRIDRRSSRRAPPVARRRRAPTAGQAAASKR